MPLKFNKWAGIKNVGDAASTRLPYVREAVNVDIPDEGQPISRRGGYGAPVLAGNFHSLRSFLGETLTLAVQGTNLVIVESGWTTTVIRSGLTAGLRMDYVEVNSDVYYTNGQVLGFVTNRKDGVFPSITKALSSRMPAGHLIEFYNGLLYVALGGTVIYSEGMDFGRTKLNKNFFSFPGRITLMKAVDDGMYFAYGKTVFVSGAKPEEFIPRDLTDYNAVPYTAVTVNAEFLAGDQPLSGPAVVWASEKGPCLGLNGGVFFNLALNKYNSPQGYEGASVFRENRKGTKQLLTILRQ